MSVPVYLQEMWPLFLLAERGEPTSRTNLTDQLIPPTLPEFRAVLGALLTRTNPTAAHGLTSTPDEELGLWILALRESVLTGDLMMTPAWLSRDGGMMRELARVVGLPFFQRMDVFLCAMHNRGSE